MLLNLLKQLAFPGRKKNSAAGKVLPQIRFKVVVVEFFDNISSNKGEMLTGLLQNCEGLDVSCLNENFDKTFLNLENRSFFDLIDKGQNIIEKTGADVLIWGCRETGRIRLNFQTLRQYESDDQSFVGLLDSMYIPATSFESYDAFSPALLNLLQGAVISAVNRPEPEYKIYKKHLLKKIIREISQIDSAKSLGLEYMPYIMNLLGIIYLSVASDSRNENDFKTIRNLFETALKYQQQVLQPTHLGCIYFHLGQLFDSASVYMNKHPAAYFRGAIQNYQLAQKHLSKYTYPYDYGFICYKLSGLYYNYWKQNEDLQALRDAVFQLRESERIFTQAQFPHFWGAIQGNLGYLLQNLGHLTKSADISRLAVNSYRNQQKIINQNHQPLYWAQIQEKIGEIYYLEGKSTGNREALEEALACFHDALYIFESAKRPSSAQKIQISIAKTLQVLSEITPDDGF